MAIAHQDVSISNTFPPLQPPKRYLFGPGPTMVHPRVYEALSKPIVGHLDPYFFRVMEDIQKLLKPVYGAVDGTTLVISATGWWIIDPLLSVLLSLMILYWAIRLILDSVDVLLEATPREIDPSRVAEAVELFEEVKDVHDIHVWTLASGMYALSAHIAVKEMPLAETSPLLKRINFLLCQRFGIGHAAIQFELEEHKR